ncbi:ABC transporter substrate-binding protein [Symbiobacterium terraclitae]|uniref:ABC transporter substrate-binding protein n=1 Tax=Symbiobacterium terraclitae TaxID=557451 RepID=UPI0035B550A8
MKKRWVGILSVLLTAALALSACGGAKQPTSGPEQQSGGSSTSSSSSSSSNTNTSAPAPAPAEQVTLRLTGWASSPAETEIVNKLLEGFSEKYPNITVKYEVVNADYDKKIQADAVANTIADVFYVDVFWAPDWINKGLAIPLDEYIKAEGVNLAEFEPSLLKGFQWDGKTYGLPKGYSTLGLFYNKKMLDEAGVAVPTTWDELREAARALTKGDVKGLSLSADHARFVPFIYMAGGQLFNEAKTEAYFNSPEAVAAAEFYTGLITKDKVADTPAGLGAGWAGDAFAQEKAAMVLEGHWMIPFLAEYPNVEYGVAELPAGPAGKSNFVFTVAYAVSKSSKHPAEAFKLVDYLTSDEAQRQMVQLGLELPSRTAVASDPFFEGKDDRAALIAGVKYAQPFQYTANQAPYVDEFGKALENMILNGKDPKSELDRVQAKFEEVIKK